MDPLRLSAQKLEISYVSQMLGAAGLGNILPSSNAAFSPFLLEAHAKSFVAQGGIGLSEQIFQILAQKELRDETTP